MELREFIIKAKKITYASGAKPSKLPDGSDQFMYAESDYKYTDTYFGSKSFTGQELVWKDNKLIWAMNYYGSGQSSEEFMQFLKKALSHIQEEKPFRGPSYFKDKDFEYFDESQGDLELFSGKEIIKLIGKDFFTLFYHGGIIK